MPKIKTSRAAAKRFKRTGSGRFKRSRTNKRHILTSKPTKRKKHLKRSGLVHPSDQKSMRRLMPYG